MPTTLKSKMNLRASRFIAVDRSQHDKIIAQGNTAQAAAAKAERTGKPFTLSFVPPAGKKCYF
jgi:hypothetical protein